MGKLVRSFVCVAAVLLAWPGKALPQEPSADTVKAAKELMVAAKMADQITHMLPLIMQQLKPLIARGNPLVERDFDALLPVMMASMNSYMEDFLSEGAKIYARHLTAEDMHAATAFFRSAAGRNFLLKQPEIMQESAAMGSKFGQMAARELQERITGELRKRGHNI